MEQGRRSSLHKRRMHSGYVSKASPLKISYTPSNGESSSSLTTELEANTVSESNDETAPPEAARRNMTEAPDIYPTVGRDSLEDVIGMNMEHMEFSRLSVPVVNSAHASSTFQTRSIPILDHIVGSESDRGSENGEEDMSIDTSVIWTAAPLLDHLTPPPSRDRHDIKKSAFWRAGQIYQSFETGLHTPDTQIESSANQNEGVWIMRDYKRRRTSEIIEGESVNAYNDVQPTSDIIPGTMDDLEDELANTSIIEDEQTLSHAIKDRLVDVGMQCTSEYGNETEREFSEQPEILKELDSLRQKENLNSIAQPNTQWDSKHRKEAIKVPQTSVNEMTVVASVVGEVLMETIREATSESEVRAGIKLFKKQAEVIFVEQMNLWSENELLQKERRIEIGKGKRLRAKLLEIRTRRQALQAEMKKERETYEAKQHDNKESHGLQEFLGSIQSLKIRIKQSNTSENNINDKHRISLQGTVKSLASRCGEIDDDGHRQGGLLQLLRDFNQKLEIWNANLESQQMCS
ncbi:hypothetical protein NQZ79_g7924 [Umbelopsis isabellina]|nr:hypothetical protein NQZ79_g7924 [Umbelopsis isabellina]